MSVYSSTTPCRSIHPGDAYTVVSAETLVTGTAYARVAIGNVYNQGSAKLVLEIVFSADPGAFQVDIQDSDTDSAGYYVNVPSGGSATTVNAAFVARIELDPFVASFARPICTNDPDNAVTCTMRFIR